MPFTVIHPGEAATDTVVEDWRCVGEKVRPQDGATVRLWSRRVLDLKQRLEHTRDRFEVLKEGQIVRSEEHARSPATRWYAQHEAAELYVTAGFADIRLLSGFTFCPATGEETLFCVLGTKPHGGNGTGTHP